MGVDIRSVRSSSKESVFEFDSFGETAYRIKLAKMRSGA
jgi:hypothetical protein